MTHEKQFYNIIAVLLVKNVSLNDLPVKNVIYIEKHNIRDLYIEITY